MYPRIVLRTGRSMVALVTTIALVMLAWTAASYAHPSERHCGSIPEGSVYEVFATHNVHCQEARHVIKGFAFRGHRRVDGFRCHSERRGRYGVVELCKKDNKRVRGVTGI